MVEGPEATHLANKLQKHFTNKRLQHVKIKDGRYKHHGPPDNYRAFVRQLPLRLLDVGNKGKVIFFLFEGGWFLIAKLGMVGWFYEPGDKLWFDPKPNIEFAFSGTSKSTAKPLFFSDFRNFGTLTFTQDMMEVLREYNAIASDILAPSTTYRSLTPIIRTLQATNPQMTIDTLLMDQTLLISGIGNIIKSELLYDARISPHRRVDSLTPANWQAIVTAARRFTKQTLAVLEDSSENADADADFSKYTAIRRVYDRKEDPHKNKVHTYKSADGRTTFWVPSLQL